MADMDLRQERRLYHAKTLADLDAQAKDLATMGWVSLGQSQCDPRCKCGKGPYWEAFLLELPTSTRELN
ncbi:hypothetical protein [Roseobacter phage RDJL6]|nr:hypothetical protein [Roseobacter phage RDJL6]